ncbi:MAG: hypothetical protein HYR55_06915 [Acidobacteria bacterium]|nr:hypothetical protein [Acidobacteriota bacterium]MBI3655218.1 hypothetical protein [Acidobacteriota bacterium]
MPKDEFDFDDPMELVGVELPEGNPEVMAECFVEEFARMGSSDSEIFALFQSPFYAATHRIYQEKGEDFVRAVIQRVRSQWGGP